MGAIARIFSQDLFVLNPTLVAGPTIRPLQSIQCQTCHGYINHPRTYGKQFSTLAGIKPGTVSLNSWTGFLIEPGDDFIISMKMESLPNKNLDSY